MKLTNHTRRAFIRSSSALTALALSSFASLSAADEAIPKPDDKPADMTKPVQVFVMMGQSNMVGMGKVSGPADSLEAATKTDKKYPYLLDEAGNWSERKDVRNVRVMAR